MAAQIGQIEGLTDIDVSYSPGRPELQIDVDRQRASDLGLNTAQIASNVRLLVNGETATTFRGEGDEAAIRVQLAESDRTSAADLLSINLLSPNGQLVPLRSVAGIDEAVGPNAISRNDQQPIVTITANGTRWLFRAGIDAGSYGAAGEPGIAGSDRGPAWRHG